MIDLKHKHLLQLLFPHINWMSDNELETWCIAESRNAIEARLKARPQWEQDQVEASLSFVEDEIARRKLLAKEGAPPYDGKNTIEKHQVDELKQYYTGDTFIRLFQLMTGFEVIPVHTSERWKYRCQVHGKDKNPSGVLYPSEGRYWCFTCGAGGDFINLVQTYHRCSFREAIEWLQDQAMPREYRKKGKQWKLKA